MSSFPLTLARIFNIIHIRQCLHVTCYRFVHIRIFNIVHIRAGFLLCPAEKKPDFFFPNYTRIPR